MTENKLRRMNRRELIEMIYALQHSEKAQQTAPLPGIREIEAERARLQYRQRYRRMLRHSICVLIVAAAVSVLLATQFLPILQVSGSSMEPMLNDRDIIVLFRNTKVQTGDLIGFYYQNKLLLKRVIGRPGDEIDIDAEGNVTVNGKALDEPYVTNRVLGETDRTYPCQVPENRYFVMGDNRATSVDSRNSAIGCIEKDQILGKVLLRVWPPRELSWIR